MFATRSSIAALALAGTQAVRIQREWDSEFGYDLAQVDSDAQFHTDAQATVYGVPLDFNYDSGKGGWISFDRNDSLAQTDAQGWKPTKEELELGEELVSWGINQFGLAQTDAQGWKPTKQELELGEQLAEFGLSFMA